LRVCGGKAEYPKPAERNKTHEKESNALVAPGAATVIFLLLACSASRAFPQEATVERNSNLRKSAPSSSAIVAKLAAGFHVTLISDRKRSGYYHVQAEGGAVGWAWARNITASANGEPSPSGPPSTPEPAGNGFDAGCNLPFDSIKKKHPIIDDSCTADGSWQKIMRKTTSAQRGCPLIFPMTICCNWKLLGRMSTIATCRMLRPAAPSLRTLSLSTAIALVRGRWYGSPFILSKRYADTKRSANAKTFGESVNCYRPSDEENDIHIVLGQQTKDDERISVTAEMSPHFRPVKWTQNNVNSAGEHPIRVTGSLFYDSSHVICQPGKQTAPKRASLWEIHPVYAFEVSLSWGVPCIQCQPILTHRRSQILDYAFVVRLIAGIFCVDKGELALLS
jgi:hypothetical protein